jgi:predicted AAA+ superfamily ATPase
MVGQLTDAGNTTTLARYLTLLTNAFFVSGLEKFSRRPLKRKSSPKLIVWNNALITAPGMTTFEQMKTDPAIRGRLVENAVGAHLSNHLQGMRFEVSYWRERHQEVDFVVSTPEAPVAIEVKSGKSKPGNGLAHFKRLYPESKPLIVGTGGLSLEAFFERNPLVFL